MQVYLFMNLKIVLLEYTEDCRKTKCWHWTIPMSCVPDKELRNTVYFTDFFFPFEKCINLSADKYACFIVCLWRKKKISCCFEAQEAKLFLYMYLLYESQNGYIRKCMFEFSFVTFCCKYLCEAQSHVPTQPYCTHYTMCQLSFEQMRNVFILYNQLTMDNICTYLL